MDFKRRCDFGMMNTFILKNANSRGCLLRTFVLFGEMKVHRVLGHLNTLGHFLRWNMKLKHVY